MANRLKSSLRAAALTLLLAGSAVLPGGAGAQGLAGPYLAAILADFRNDYVAAAEHYARALARDPGNVGLMQNTLVSRIAAADFEGALALAADLAAAAPDNEIAGLVLGADALGRGDYEAAAELLSAETLGLNPLLDGLVSGWIAVGREDFEAAQARFDALDDNELIGAYGRYHKALALALAGDFVSAEALFAGIGDPLPLEREAIIAHAEVLAQLGREEEAIAQLDAILDTGFPDLVLLDLRRRLASGDEVPFSVIRRPSDGAAEAFLTFATALNTEESDRFSLIYARLAGLIRPGLSRASLLAAEILERHGQYDLAIEALADVPEDSVWFVTAELRRAATQRAAGDPDAGIATLRALAERHPGTIEVHSALGDALRVAEHYEEAAAAYSRAIDLIGEPAPAHWPIFYARAIAWERAGIWDRAETDFRRALELEPEQPLVLNYLGYSLVEQRRNLDEALDMIERAVASEPDDGYIIDSLGWVLYRLGRYEEALPHLLRAVELLPTDAVLNDHLGDVLWMVGREREARFQWSRALSFGPAEDLDMDRIRRKLEVGLDAVLAEEEDEATVGTAPAETAGGDGAEEAGSRRSGRGG
ncbi:MAG TPA: tetratricopeptide repeat protein [Paracoccaceae bacterium]|nr:tetratricopeptide repeat protein [Paracoccaceae bacterium]